MSDSGSNSTLTDFSGGGGGERDVAAEARAVAGTDDQNVDSVVEADDWLPARDGEIELSVIQVDYTIEGSGDDEKPVVHVFGRTADNDLEHVTVHEFEPYFYAPTDSLDAPPEDQYDRLIDSRETDENGDPFVSIRGEKLTKIVGQTPRDVGNIRDDFDHYEADILFPNRFLIDKDIKSGIRIPERRDDEGTLHFHDEVDELETVEVQADPRVHYFDIEVDDRSGFPEEGEEPIICLTTFDSYDETYIAWLADAPEGDAEAPEELPGYDPIEDIDLEVRSFPDEREMLEAYLDYLNETDVDVISGWNADDFDAPYLIDRLDELDGPHEYDLDSDRLSRVDEVWHSDWGAPTVKGRVVFDLLYAYKRTQFTELESYRLDAVGEVELGVGKERYAGDIGDLWEDDPERLLEYNVRDVELCVQLDRKQDIVSFWEEVASFVGCKLEDATTPGDAVDMYVLHKAYGEFALPSKGKQESEDYEGGAVFEPITGVKENVTVLDLKCFSGDTQVLTPTGTRNITDMEVGDDVYTLNPETFECEVKPVVDTQSYSNKYGELHHLSGSTHDLKVTENHRFLCSSKRGWDDLEPTDFEFSEYRDLTSADRFAFPNHEPMSGERPETFALYEAVTNEAKVAVYSDNDLRWLRHRLPDETEQSLNLVHGSSSAAGLQQKVGKYLLPVSVYRAHREEIEEHADDVFLKYGKSHSELPTEVEMDDWLELVGWYVTEGSVDVEHGRFTLHQSDEDGRDSITSLLDRIGIDYSTDQRGVNVSNAILVDWLVENCGKGFAEKQLPKWVFDLDGRLLETLLKTAIGGDGSRTESGLRKFWTKSDQLKRDVSRVAVRCGHKPTVTKQNDGTWYLSIGKQGSFCKDTNATVEDHDGDVHCLTAKDNHVVLAGRNGHFQWVGQSLYPMSMTTINASPETKVDPGEYDGETYRAPTGTHFRKEPDGIIREIIDETLAEREEKKALRNERDPDTPEYERFDRQQAAVKVIMNCFTPDTEVLTPEGVRNIRDLDVGDEVYSLDPETEEMERKPVVETHAYPDYRGDLVDIETSKMDFRVTPNHRMLVRKNETNGSTEDGYSFVEAGELDRATNYELPHDWDGPEGTPIEEIDLTELADDYEVWANHEVHGHTLAAEIGWYPDKVQKSDIDEEGYVFSADEFEEHREYLESVCSEFYVHAESGRKWIPRTYDGDDFLELLAWYVTEGNVYTSEEKQFGENYRGSATSIQIAQDAVMADGGEGDHSAIGDLLDRMGFDYYVDDTGYQFTSKLLGEVLERLCGDSSFEKRIPEFVFESSQKQKRRFLETLVDGDGDRQKNSWRYSTASDRLRDDVLRLCAHLGLTTNYRKDSGAWRIYCTEDSKNTLRMHRSSSRSTADDGVYCVTVEDNHTLLAGRNGKFQFVGQSLYGVLGWERFRLYDKAMGAAITATGREVIEHTQATAEEMDYDVAYGDTDSVMLEVGHISPADIDGEVEVTDGMREAHPEMDEEELESLAATIQKGYEVEEQINDSYDEFALEELNAAAHRFQIEFEKLYRRFFQAGKKKRYAGHIVWKEGKDVDDIDITGFEYKRSDIAPITKEVQKRVIDMIVHGEDLDDVKDYVHDVIEDYQAGNVNLDDVGIPGGIGKRLDAYDTDTAQVRGAKYANVMLGTNFQRGSKPKRLYLEGVHPDFWQKMEDEEGFDPSGNSREDRIYREFKKDPDVICFEFADQVPDEFDVDWDKMLDKTLQGPIERILEALDISWDEVKSGQEQTGLGSFV
ncbi:DNA polymerase domain-containing protein [Halorussus lipolyticus]|uniref:DNA polymerase domain-containing protein n=1 Tax=Halorussus lipolyticus TaxID=3034024 RepID=UPI0023E84B44|nr:DNA polymerase domain-containing protein [Halorussus sp. DT80]